MKRIFLFIIILMPLTTYAGVILHLSDGTSLYCKKAWTDRDRNRTICQGTTIWIDQDSVDRGESVEIIESDERSERGNAHIMCPVFKLPCVGKHGGGTCYNSVSEQCNNGLVCKTTEKFCIGEYGAVCYNPYSERCFNGIVCEKGELLCDRVCYNPSKKEKCDSDK